MDETEGLIDLVRTDGASDVAAVLKEQPDGGWKVSLRSKGATDVGRAGHRASAAAAQVRRRLPADRTPTRWWRPWSPS
jgi:hypothetical protein